MTNSQWHRWVSSNTLEVNRKIRTLTSPLTTSSTGTITQPTSQIGKQIQFVNIQNANKVNYLRVLKVWVRSTLSVLVASLPDTALIVTRYCLLSSKFSIRSARLAPTCMSLHSGVVPSGGE